MIIVPFFINLVTFYSKVYTREINKECPSSKIIQNSGMG